MTPERTISPTLAPGHHLYPGPDGTWRCYLAGERFLRLRAPAASLSRLAPVLHGRSGAPDGVTFTDTDVAALLAAFETQGLLASDVALAVRPRPTAYIEGDNPVADLVASLLAGVASVERGDVDEDVIGRSDIVVTVAGWLPDARWQQVDQWVRDAGVPWHMCHAEGSRIFVGPLFVPGATASYRDTRGRRLAAAGAPDELEIYWAYLDRGADQPVVPWPQVGGVAIAAGLLVSDVVAYLSGRPVPSHGCQVELSPDTSTVVPHPVLPLPIVMGSSPAR